jgi:hypothetical protein
MDSTYLGVSSKELIDTGFAFPPIADKNQSHQRRKHSNLQIRNPTGYLYSKEMMQALVKKHDLF